MVIDLVSVPSLTYALISLAVALLVKAVLFPSTPDNIPPLPARPYPILGHLPYLLTGQRQKLLDWRKSTGDIFSLYFGSRLVVILNGYKLVKEGLVGQADALSDRPPWKHLEGSTNGLIFSNGHLWKEQRSLSIAILRSFGMGKGVLSAKINEEVSSYLEALAALDGKPTDVILLTRTSVSNVICSIIVGKRYDYNDPFFAAFMDSFDKQVWVGDFGFRSNFSRRLHFYTSKNQRTQLLSNSYVNLNPNPSVKEHRPCPILMLTCTIPKFPPGPSVREHRPCPILMLTCTVPKSPPGPSVKKHRPCPSLMLTCTVPKIPARS
ncbi:hypothetical protein RRG08_063209 [Elysia crispata]|uniref:Cytochrome P450 n=1 Tax=Elysia crispata TaxID=231223 RepID=A0AAE0Y9W3_9GAST|nr:hypothetical protein RRG08_063209 [Elysia crispata]